MNQLTLILDLDDTLVHCNKYFKQSRIEFVNQLKKWFITLTEEEITQKQFECDLKNIEKNGLHSSGYPESLVLTYRYFCEKYRKKSTDYDIEIVRKIGEKVFEIDVEPLPNMYEVLDELQKDGHHLYLFTGGDTINQYRKVSQLGLEDYFKRGIFIFQHKNTMALKKVLKQIKSNKKSTWMVGNSLKTDIKPAIELGINSIHIPSEIEWSYNILDLNVEPSGTFAELKSLDQLPEFLREHIYFHQVI